MLVVQVNWLGRDDGRATHTRGRTRPYQHGGRETPKLELDRASFRAGWGRVAWQLCDGANNATNRIEVIFPLNDMATAARPRAHSGGGLELGRQQHRVIADRRGRDDYATAAAARCEAGRQHGDAIVA